MIGLTSGVALALPPGVPISHHRRGILETNGLACQLIWAGSCLPIRVGAVMNKIFAAFFLPFLFVFPVFAQSYRGEQPVRLLERAANIPAHRGPRDRPAALFRSVGGSTGKIIAVDRATGRTDGSFAMKKLHACPL